MTAKKKGVIVLDGRKLASWASGLFVVIGSDGKLIPCWFCGKLLCEESVIDGGTLRCSECDGDRSSEVLAS